MATSCMVCGGSLARMTVQERTAHVNDCLDGNRAVDACPVCAVSMAHLTVAERNAHVDECSEDRKDDDDFVDDSVLNAFDSVDGAIDVGRPTFQCWVCAKVFNARAPVKSRLQHLVECTRVPMEVLQEIFVGGGDDDDEDDRAERWERCRGTAPARIVASIRRQLAVVDRQLLSLNLCRQNLQVQLDRAMSIASRLPQWERSAVMSAAVPERPAIVAEGVEGNVGTVVTEQAASAQRKPALKESVLGKRFARVADLPGPEDMRRCLEREDDDDDDDDSNQAAGPARDVNPFVGCFTQADSD
ncbi:unnamed protein product (mitochondrion) [Plasmodiophora brassicae]|uniref:Uncharacterized protein n=1 Tax=Plasmodiophora brassicae TaxID=37360 RepID=A0A0G4J841_PLABS|nr:hypothetical protein PBRA_003385 [Plasmodiophora brassicae]SPQ99737.1 unnamed protein product [Plasmodiophora brassicae]